MSAVRNYSNIFCGVEPGAHVFWCKTEGEPSKKDVDSLEKNAIDLMREFGFEHGVLFSGRVDGMCFLAFSTGCSFGKQWRMVKKVKAGPSLAEKVCARWSSWRIKNAFGWFALPFSDSPKFSVRAWRQHYGTPLWGEYGSLQCTINFWRFGLKLYRPTGSALPKDKPPRWMLP